MGYILVTGSNGMLGKHVVNRLLEAGYKVLGISIEDRANIINKNYIYKTLDLTNCVELEAIFSEYNISHVIHLAAVAHIHKGMDDSWSQYYRINTLCSKTIFKCASTYKIPVFFTSSIDVYGINENEVDEKILPKPISFYARSKWMAENLLQEICKNGAYLIARFVPIYTEDNKKDIRKRFYINYPNICYRLGKGKEYEFLSINKVLELILWWVSNSSEIKDIVNIRDKKRFNTKELIDIEQASGKVKFVIKLPEWVVACLKFTIDLLLKNNLAHRFTAYKVINPIRTNDRKLRSYTITKV